MWQYMLLCGVGTKPVTRCNTICYNNMILTVLNLHQKTPKGATTKIQVKRYKRDRRDKII